MIGDGNRLAHAAALAVAEQPGQAYNPLFIHGPPGLGKTHLLHAIGNYVAAYGGGLTVRYATVEDFTSRVRPAVRGGGSDDFRERFRDADVLLIDDVQFLAEKVRTEEEFFHTFNALYESGSQLVLTSDRRPTDLDGLRGAPAASASSAAWWPSSSRPTSPCASRSSQARAPGRPRRRARRDARGRRRARGAPASARSRAR